MGSPGAAEEKYIAAPRTSYTLRSTGAVALERTRASAMISDGGATLPEHERGPSRAARIEALAVASIVAVAYLVLRTATSLAAGAFADDGVYLSLGRALADGEGYRSVYAVGAPVHLKYPPGLPVVHAFLWSIRADLAFVHAAALLVSLLATATAAGILWWIARERFQLPLSLAGVFVLGPFLLEGSVQYFNLAISEPWFLLGCASCLLLAPRATLHWSWAVALGALVAATTLFRTQAVVLLPALAASVWMESKDPKKSAALIAAGVVPLLGWTLWHRARIAAGPVSTQPDEATYASWAPDSVGEAVALGARMLRAQADGYWAVLPANFASWTWLGVAIWLVILVGVAVGVAKHWRDRSAPVLTLAALGATVVCWPYVQDRFVWALLPLAGLVAAAGYRSVAWTRRSSDGHARPTPALAAGLALLVGIVGIRQAEIRGLAAIEEASDAVRFHPAQLLPANTEFVIAASRWLASSAWPADRLLTPLPAALWLYTGWRGVNSSPAEPNVGASVFDVPGEFLARRVLEDGVTLLFLWNRNFPITRDATAVQQACPQALEFLALTEEPTRVAIFRIHARDPCFGERFLEPARRARATP
jgi:hypothetical protein